MSSSAPDPTAGSSSEISGLAPRFQSGLLSLLSMLSLTIPITIPSYVVMTTLTNNPIHSILYSLFLIAFTALHNVILNWKETHEREAAPLMRYKTICSLFPLRNIGLEDRNHNISISQFILWFSAMFLLYPMYQVDTMDVVLLIILICLVFVDMAYKLKGACTSVVGLIISGIFGLVCGLISIYLVINMMGSNSFIYQSKSGTVCTKPSRQKMVCNVYKNGRLIQSNPSS